MKTNTMEIQGIIRIYSDNPYSNKLENVEEIDKFLGTYEHQKLNQEDINHLNRSATQNEIETAINCFPKKKSPVPHGFSAKLYQTFKEDLTRILLKFFHEIEREATLPNSFYEASITLIPTQTKTHLKSRATGQSP
jgi:hypothetical protein